MIERHSLLTLYLFLCCQGGSEFIGRARAQPLVKLDPSDPHSAVLSWFTVYKGDKYAGELLAAFELLMVSERESGERLSLSNRYTALHGA